MLSGKETACEMERPITMADHPVERHGRRAPVHPADKAHGQKEQVLCLSKAALESGRVTLDGHNGHDMKPCFLKKTGTKDE